MDVGNAVNAGAINCLESLINLSFFSPITFASLQNKISALKALLFLLYQHSRIPELDSESRLVFPRPSIATL